MTFRTLVAVGCNLYDNLGQLVSAELDAKRLYSELIEPLVGDYDLNKSVLLLSPTYFELRAALESALFNPESIDTFTFFFAGHGGVKSGSYYLCLKDTRTDAMSASALSLTDLLAFIREKQPGQSNIIIDACSGGGLINDLSAILKPGIMGDAGTPGVTILSTSAQDESAGEGSEGGFGTNCILQCIKGTNFVQDFGPTLDLIDIGRAILPLVQTVGAQTPVTWGLNLTGPPRFCRNPHFGLNETAPLRGVVSAWPRETEMSIRLELAKLWRIYDSITEMFDQQKFVRALMPIVESLSSVPEAVSTVFGRLDAAFMIRAAQSRDVFRGVQVSSALATCLLKLSSSHEVARYAAGYQRVVASRVGDAVETLLIYMNENEFALLGSDGGLSDLFFLPLRVSSVLGWAALAVVVELSIGDGERPSAVRFSSLLRLVIKNYDGAIVAISDKQAACWALTLSTANQLGMSEEVELIASFLYHSIVENSGQLADVYLPPDKIPGFLLQRHDVRDSNQELIARPSELILAVLAMGSKIDLEEPFDDALWKLDGVSVGTYVPQNLFEFAEPQMLKGINRSLRLAMISSD